METRGGNIASGHDKVLYDGRLCLLEELIPVRKADIFGNSIGYEYIAKISGGQNIHKVIRHGLSEHPYLTKDYAQIEMFSAKERVKELKAKLALAQKELYEAEANLRYWEET
jgi:hypothetical protein